MHIFLACIMFSIKYVYYCLNSAIYQTAFKYSNLINYRYFQLVSLFVVHILCKITLIFVLSNLNVCNNFWHFQLRISLELDKTEMRFTSFSHISIKD